MGGKNTHFSFETESLFSTSWRVNFTPPKTTMDPPRERLSGPHEGCAYSTLRPGLLKSHESGHTGVFPFQCDEGGGCEFAATTGNVLKQHKRIAHREMELLACPSTACGA